jgi:phenylpropionate dioxygenase-like ring-hydroxylating dioxygenase large terminal subunit
MKKAAKKVTPIKAAFKRQRAEPVPFEGDNGVFTESWFPICPSYELKQGEVIGRPFLDGRIVAFRGEDGVAQVLSAYCPHMGADLSVGDVCGNHIRCAFHKWEYDGEGICRKTGIGDPAPKNARVFKFPCVEKYGLIWAFNGLEPWWQLPEFPFPEKDLAIDVRYDVPILPVDPWVVCANTPDWQHIKIVHHVDFDTSDMYKRIKFTDHSMEYSFKGRMEMEGNEEVNYNVGIYGTSMFMLHGTRNGLWFCTLTAFGLPRPSQTQNYFVIGLKKGDGSPQSSAQIAFLHNQLFLMGRRMVAEDRPILHTLKYTPGAMTKSDMALARFLNLVRKFPRSHHSADFIN